jgi:heterodisulfide reductase subunit C
MPGDEQFKQEVLRLAGQEVLTCIQCGTCSASPKVDQTLPGGQKGGGYTQ